MFESWHILNVDYTASDSAETRNAMFPYISFSGAEKVFSQLNLSYQLELPIRIQNDKMIKVTRLQLYEVFKFEKADAINALKAGDGTLLCEAGGVDIDV